MFNKKKVEWDPNGRVIVEKFACQLEHFWETGERPKYGSRIFNVALEKQRDYMAKQGLHMTYEFTPSGNYSDNCHSRTWSDEMLTHLGEFRISKLDKRIYKGDKCIWRKKTPVTFYATITNVRNPELLAKKEYNCPNCGAISTVEQLQDMCPYCQTRFKMYDLFPEVMNYYTFYNNSLKALSMGQYKFIATIPMFIIFCIALKWNLPDCTIWIEYVAQIILALIAGGIGGLIPGLVIIDLLAFKSVFSGAKSEIQIDSITRGSTKRFVKVVQKYSPFFSYQYFANKAVSILRQLLSEEDIRDNPYYDGMSIDIKSRDIIEYEFTGKVSLSKCEMVGTICRATVNVYIIDYYWDGRNIKRHKDRFHMLLEKDLSNDIDYAFSLTAITCKNCGGSFDATKKKFCPYCNTKYVIGSDDWLVKSIYRA